MRCDSGVWGVGFCIAELDNKPVALVVHKRNCDVDT